MTAAKKPRRIDVSQLSVGEWTPPRRHKIDEAARFFDSTVADAYRAYLEAGEPERVADRPGRYIEVSDTALGVSTVRKMLRAAADRQNIGLRFGEVERPRRGIAHVTFTCQSRKSYDRTSRPRALAGAGSASTSAA